MSKQSSPVRWQYIGATIALLGLVFVVYWPGRYGGFTFDDYPNIVNNVALQVDSLNIADWLAAVFSSPASELQRPVAMFTFAVNTYFTGLDPTAMKLTNIGIHVLNSLLVLLLLRGLLRFTVASTERSPISVDWLALLITAAWALHPINLMPVLFIVQRMEALSHTFVFLGLIAYFTGRSRQLQGKRGGGLVFGGLFLASAIGVLAKESAALLPLYAFAVEWCLLGFRDATGGRDKRLMAMYAVVLILPAVAGLAWLLPKVLAPNAYASREFTLVERLLTEPRVVLDYLRWTIAPSLRELALHHDDYVISRGLLQPSRTLFAIATVGLLVALLPWLRKVRALSCLGLTWFLGAQVLTATVIPLELVFEHRNYFASLGVCLVLADLLILAPGREGWRRFGLAFATLGVITFAATTFLRASEWSDPVRFARSEAAKHPDSPRATYTLGQTLVIASRYRKDSPLVPEAYRALERALIVDKRSILTHSTLLLLSSNTGRPQESWWWRDMQYRLSSRSIGPQDVNAIGSLERCARMHPETCKFPIDEMMKTFEAGLLMGRNSDVLVMYGSYELHVLGRSERALQMWREAVRVTPKQAQYRINLIKLLIWLGRTDEASAELDRLRDMGHFNQHAAAVQDLEAKLEGDKPPLKPD